MTTIFTQVGHFYSDQLGQYCCGADTFEGRSRCGRFVHQRYPQLIADPVSIDSPGRLLLRLVDRIERVAIEFGVSG